MLVCLILQNPSIFYSIIKPHHLHRRNQWYELKYLPTAVISSRLPHLENSGLQLPQPYSSDSIHSSLCHITVTIHEEAGTIHEKAGTIHEGSWRRTFIFPWLLTTHLAPCNCYLRPPLHKRVNSFKPWKNQNFCFLKLFFSAILSMVIHKSLSATILRRFWVQPVWKLGWEVKSYSDATQDTPRGLRAEDNHSGGRISEILPGWVCKDRQGFVTS